MRQLRHLTAVLAVLAGGLTLTACGSGEREPSSSGQETKSIAITFEGDTVTPNGERVEVARDQPVELVVSADAPGEIHVHSDPEQELEYEKGTTILKVGPFDKAGLIDVESHHLDRTIVQLQVT